MTNEEIIERLFALKEWLKRNFGEQFPQEYLDSISSAIEFISSSPSPSLPSDLDEAAETYAENILANGEDMFDAIADGFRAGEEWLARQGVSMLGKVGIYGVDVESITEELREAGFNLGEEIILQIRKKQ